MILNCTFGSTSPFISNMSACGKSSNNVKDALPTFTASNNIVTELNDFDVLLGRGMPILKKSGNSRFRTLIVNYREEYRSINRHAFKDEIARRIMLTIRVLGGRFVRQIETSSEREMYNVDNDTDAWIVIDEEASLLKIKQALRELPWNAEPRRASKRTRDGPSSHLYHTELSLFTSTNRAVSLPDLPSTAEHPIRTSFSDNEYSPMKRRKLDRNNFEQMMMATTTDTSAISPIVEGTDTSMLNNIGKIRMDDLLMQRQLEDMTFARNASHAKGLRMLRQQIAAGKVSEVQYPSTVYNINREEQRQAELRMLQQSQQNLSREELSLHALPLPRRRTTSPTTTNVGSNRLAVRSSSSLFLHESLSLSPSLMNTRIRSQPHSYLHHQEAMLDAIYPSMRPERKSTGTGSDEKDNHSQEQQQRVKSLPRSKSNSPSQGQR